VLSQRLCQLVVSAGQLLPDGISDISCDDLCFIQNFIRRFRGPIKSQASSRSFRPRVRSDVPNKTPCFGSDFIDLAPRRVCGVTKDTLFNRRRG
jgi:hypothetical protein